MSNETLAGWLDLTVPDASRARSFYAQVLGVSHSAVAMSDARGDYADFCLHVGDPAVTPPLAGVCHARSHHQPRTGTSSTRTTPTPTRDRHIINLINPGQAH